MGSIPKPPARPPDEVPQPMPMPPPSPSPPPARPGRGREREGRGTALGLRLDRGRDRPDRARHAGAAPDGVPRSKGAIVAALAGRHGKADVVHTLMRLSVTGRLDEAGGRYRLGAEAG